MKPTKAQKPAAKPARKPRQLRLTGMVYPRAWPRDAAKREASIERARAWLAKKYPQLDAIAYLLYTGAQRLHAVHKYEPHRPEGR